MTLHPATLLLAWGGLAILLQSLSAGWLALATLLIAPFPLILAPSRTFLLLRRARWLLLSIAVMFVLGTPGERLPDFWGDLGLTHDGIIMAAEHVLRLVLLLATLALLHEKLGNAGLISGLYSLLAPLASLRELRARIVVRLMLVLDYVETPPAGGWRAWLAEDRADQRPAVSLALAPLGWGDRLIMLVLLGAALSAWWYV